MARNFVFNKGKVMTLTKAELADLLFEKVGLNKREAKDMAESFFEESCPASAISSCATSRSVLAAIPRPEKKSRLPHVVW